MEGRSYLFVACIQSISPSHILKITYYLLQVKFELEQDNALFRKDIDYGDKKSTKKKGVTSPEYGETFEWEEVDTLDNVVLRCKVMDGAFLHTMDWELRS